MKVGLIGAGGIAQAIASHLVAAQIEDIVLSNSRGPASLAEVVAALGGKTRAGLVSEAADADLVFLSVPWSRIPDAVGQVPNWSGRVVVDTTNPLEGPTFQPADLGDLTSSQVVAGLVPGAHVVKAFNTLAPALLGSASEVGGGRRVAFYSGDDRGAKERFAELATRLGLAAVDLGPLATGGALQQFPGGSLPGRQFVEI